MVSEASENQISKLPKLHENAVKDRGYRLPHFHKVVRSNSQRYRRIGKIGQLREATRRD